MTFQQLRYLLDVSKTRSVSKTAEKFFVSRPSISFSINNVETEVGYPIFQRTKEGLIPTRQGAVFLEYARQVCDTHKLMTNIDLSKQNHINIAVMDYPPINNAVCRLVEEYRNRKDVFFTFNVYSINEILDKLSRFELDVALFSRMKPMELPLEAQMEKRGLTWNALRRIPTVIYLGPGHPLYDKPVLSPRDLDHYTFLDTPQKEVSRHHYIKSIVNIPPECVIPINSTTCKYQLISNGLAYTIGRVPAKPIIDRYGFRCIPIAELSQRLTCVTNPQRSLPPEAKRFLEILDEELEKHTDEY